MDKSEIMDARGRLVERPTASIKEVLELRVDC